MRRLPIVCCLLACAVASAVADNRNAPPVDAMSAQRIAFPQEKVHVTTDKDFYLSGDTVWLRAHVVDAASHQPVHQSNYVYAELADAAGKLLRRIKILRQQGVCAGYIPLDITLASGEYTLSAYTRHQLNQDADLLFRKRLTIASCRETQPRSAMVRQVGDFDVRFYPEGGAVLADMPHKVAFRAVGDDGLGVQIEGRVVDEQGEECTTFRSGHAGYGSYSLYNSNGGAFYAECRTPSGAMKRFALPAATASGVVLQVFQNDSLVYVFRRTTAVSRPARLVVLSRGREIVSCPWPVTVGRIILRREALPEGVVQLLLLGDEGACLSERLLFNNVAPRAVAAITPSAEGGAYKPRGKVTLDITLTDRDGNPLNGELALSVTDRAAVSEPTGADAVVNLLLNSELAGYVESPEWYFEGGKERLAELDNLLLTHRWSRYDVPEALRTDSCKIPSIPFERHQRIDGRVERKGLFVKKKGLERYKLLALVPHFGEVQQTDIAPDGRFGFDKMDYPDSTRVVLCPMSPNEQGAKMDYWTHIHVTEERFAELEPLPAPKMVPAPEKTPDEVAQTPDEAAKAREYLQRAGSADMRNVTIEAVAIVADRERNMLSDTSRPEFQLASHTWTSKRIEESGVASILDVLRRMGLMVDRATIRYRGSIPAIVVDGEVYSGREDVAEMGDSSFGLQYPIEYVARIDLVQSNEAFSLWGPRASGGAVAITLKTGEELQAAMRASKKSYTDVVTLLGYQTPVVFRSPDYSAPQSANTRIPDYRTTLYWNPSLKVTDGRAKVEFYTNDTSAGFRVHAEGLSGGVVIVARSGE